MNDRYIYGLETRLAENMNTINIDDLASQGYPGEAEMVELVNSDLLRFFDEVKHEPVGFQFSDEYKVTELIGESGKDFLFKRVDGKELAVWKDYFLNPELWKQQRQLKIQGIPY